MTVQRVGTQWVANPANNFCICIPEHWKAFGNQDNPGLLIIQSDDKTTTLTISAYGRKPDMDLSKFADLRLSLVDENLEPVSERTEESGIIYRRFEGIAEGEELFGHYIIAAKAVEEGYFSFSLVTDAEHFDRNKSFLINLLNSAKAT